MSCAESGKEESKGNKTDSGWDQELGEGGKNAGVTVRPQGRLRSNKNGAGGCQRKWQVSLGKSGRKC